MCPDELHCCPITHSICSPSPAGCHTPPPPVVSCSSSGSSAGSAAFLEENGRGDGSFSAEASAAQAKGEAAFLDQEGPASASGSGSDCSPPQPPPVPWIPIAGLQLLALNPESGARKWSMPLFGTWTEKRDRTSGQAFLSSDKKSKLYVAGSFSDEGGGDLMGALSPVGLGGPAGTDTPLQSKGGTDIFVASLGVPSAAGKIEWTVLAGGAGDESVTGLVAEGGGDNLVLSGEYDGKQGAQFGSLQVKPIAENRDAFIAKGEGEEGEDEEEKKKRKRRKKRREGRKKGNANFLDIGIPPPPSSSKGAQSKAGDQLPAD